MQGGCCFMFAEYGLSGKWLELLKQLAPGRAASGHVAVVPVSSEMKSRRVRSGRDVRFIARPPHRTVRAAFPHTAPTLGV
jgi:hypothetical protein